MHDLIKIQESPDGTAVVSAKELHLFLEPKTRFNDWISLMLDYGFVENIDFTKILVKGVVGRPSQDYALTIDTAKEIAMVQRSEKGKEARQYFIECERQLKAAKVIAPPTNTLDFLQLALDQMRAQESRISEVENKVLMIEAQTATRPDYLTVMGYAIISKVKVSLSLAAVLGRKAKKICVESGYHVDKVRDPRFGEVGVYPTSVLQQVFSSTSLS